jgi:hypothetical protein
MSETPRDPLLEAFQRVCIDASPSDDDVALLEREGGGPPGRFGLYRELVRTRLRDLVRAAFPRTTRALGAARMDALAEQHLAEAPPASRFFRDHAHAFAEWALPVLTRGPVEPPWAPDLLRLEAAQWQANYAPIARPDVVEELDLERVPVASSVLVQLRTRWSVHLADAETPQPGAFRVAVYRRPDHQVETRWMEPIWADLLERLARGDAPAIDSVRAVLAEHGRAADAAFVDEMTTFLTLLVENGALLGSLPAP